MLHAPASKIIPTQVIPVCREHFFLCSNLPELFIVFIVTSIPPFGEGTTLRTLYRPFFFLSITMMQKQLYHEKAFPDSSLCKWFLLQAAAGCRVPVLACSQSRLQLALEVQVLGHVCSSLLWRQQDSEPSLTNSFA